MTDILMELFDKALSKGVRVLGEMIELEHSQQLKEINDSYFLGLD